MWRCRTISIPLCKGKLQLPLEHDVEVKTANFVNNSFNPFLLADLLLGIK